MRKNFKSDISIKESFFDYDLSGERILVQVPEKVRIEYYTPACPKVRWVCSRIGDTFHNCSLSENGRALICKLALSRVSLGMGASSRISFFNSLTLFLPSEMAFIVALISFRARSPLTSKERRIISSFNLAIVFWLWHKNSRPKAAGKDGTVLAKRLIPASSESLVHRTPYNDE